jgi:hypothetical protein
MTNRANTPEQVVQQWIRNAQRNARRLERYQKAFDESTTDVRKHIARLEAYGARFSAHERALSKTLKTPNGKAGKR